MANPEEALRLAELISRQRAELRANEERFFAMFPGGAKSASTPTQPAAAASGASASFAEQIREIIRAEPGRLFRAGDLKRQLPGANIKLIRSTLFRLKKEPGFTGRDGAYRYAPPTQPVGLPEGFVPLLRTSG